MIENQNVIGGGEGQNRIAGLDILRVAMAFLIYLFHSNCHLGCTYGLMTDFISSGAIAMTGFFMLSGFSLYYSYSYKNFTSWNNIRTFYLKRLIAIYPLYIFVGTLGVLMKIVAGVQTLKDNLRLLPIELLGIQSIFPDSLFQYAHNDGTWFISCLFLSYILFPLLQMFIKRLNTTSTSILLLILTLLLMYSPYIAKWYEPVGLYTNPFYRMFEFTVGITIAQLCEVWRKCVKQSFNYIILLISVTFLIFGVSHNRCMENALLVEPAFVLILFSISSIPFLFLSHSKTLMYFSGISYAFFLGQTFVFNPMKLLLRITGYLPNMMLIIISFAGCILAAFILHELIEKPIGNYLRSKLLVKNKS